MCLWSYRMRSCRLACEPLAGGVDYDCATTVSDDEWQCLTQGVHGAVDIGLNHNLIDDVQNRICAVNPGIRNHAVECSEPFYNGLYGIAYLFPVPPSSMNSITVAAPMPVGPPVIK